MTKIREVTDDDIAAATRGLNMMRVTCRELHQLVRNHENVDRFASKVITRAAREALEYRRMVEITEQLELDELVLEHAKAEARR